MGRDERPWRQPEATRHFNPPAPGGAGPWRSLASQNPPAFQSTRPGWGGTSRSETLVTSKSISIHPPRVGRDTSSSCSRVNFSNFNPPAPGGAGHAKHRWWKPLDSFQSTRPGWGGTWERPYHSTPVAFQSTRPGWGGTAHGSVYTRACIFQSTRPGWGGTLSISWNPGYYSDFNPPAPGGAGPVSSLLEGRDSNFNPPAPGGAGPASYSYKKGVNNISIHPPRVGRDGDPAGGQRAGQDFNPPAPGGAGPVLQGCGGARTNHFNPPAPGGAGLQSTALPENPPTISIHPPRVGRDRRTSTRQSGLSHFNPPAPGGAGRLHFPLCLKRDDFNPPAPGGAGPASDGL